MTAIKRFASFDFHLILISVLRWCNSITGMQLRPLMNIVKSHLCKHYLLWGCYSMYKWLNTLMMRSRGASNNVRVRALWIQLGWVPSTLEVWSNCCKWVQLVEQRLHQVQWGLVFEGMWYQLRLVAVVIESSPVETSLKFSRSVSNAWYTDSLILLKQWL